MDFKETRLCKVIAVAVLFAFTFTYAGGREVAYAASAKDKPAASAQAATPKAPKSNAALMDETLSNLRDKLKSDKLTPREAQSIAAAGALDLAHYDGALREEFKATEKRLKDKGMPEAILKRHKEFTRHYQDNYEATIANLQNLSLAMLDDAVEKHRKATVAHLDKAHPAKKRIALDPKKLPHRTPPVKDAPITERSAFNDDEGYDYYAELEQDKIKPVRIAAAGSTSGLLDPGYLAETVEVKFAQEIVDKAAELGNNPLKIYEWVRNNVKFEPYYGSLKGARQTFMEGAGNDYDQSSLLIALLRASGVPARYSSGTVEMTVERAMNWLGGAKTPEVAGQIFATNGVPVWLVRDSGVAKYIRLEHVWVEAYVSMEPSMGAMMGAGGKRWTPIDPSFKAMEINNSVNLSKVVSFNEDEYLTNLDSITPSAIYSKQIREYHETHFQNTVDNYVNEALIANTFDENTYYGIILNTPQYFHYTDIVYKNMGIFPGTLPYRVTQSSKVASVTDSLRHKISLQLSLPDLSGGVGLSLTKDLAELSGKKVSLHFEPWSEIDRVLVNSNGGLFNTPSYLIEVRPIIKIDNSTVLEGQRMALGADLILDITLQSPRLSNETVSTNLSHAMGYAISIAALRFGISHWNIQDKQMQALSGTIQDSVNAFNDDYTELLHYLAIRYFMDLDNISRSLSSKMFIINTQRPSVSLESIEVDYNYVYGIAASAPEIKGILVDALMLLSAPVSLEGDMQKLVEYVKLWGLSSSHQEHNVLEVLMSSYGSKAISAVKAIQVASSQGIHIVKMNSTNISMVDAMEIPDIARESIRNAANSGDEIIVSERSVSYEGWHGVGYIARDPKTGAGAYMIVSSANSDGNGGEVTVIGGKTSKKFGGPRALLATGGKKTLNSGSIKDVLVNLIIDSQISDIEDAQAELSTTLHDVPLVYEVTLFPGKGAKYYPKSTFLNAINIPNLWIFYYFGHGNDGVLDFCNNEETSSSCIVTPSEVKNDVKIAYFAGCSIGNSFNESLQKDKFGLVELNAIADEGTELFVREEAIVSWNRTLDPIFGSSYSERVWKVFASPIDDETVDSNGNTKRIYKYPSIGYALTRALYFHPLERMLTGRPNVTGDEETATVFPVVIAQ